MAIFFALNGPMRYKLNLYWRAKFMLVNKRRFGLYLSKARLRVGISQGDLASSLGYTSPQFVSNWERGAANPPLEKIPQLAKILNIPIEDMINLILQETEQYLNSELKGRRKVNRKA